MNATFEKNYGLWELAVLSLLRERPMHPYEIQRLLKERHKDDVLLLKKGSLYHAISRLEQAGLIEHLATTREGLRPERDTYSLAAAGRQALQEWLERLIAVPQREPSDFMGAVSFLIHLTPAEATECLQRRIPALQHELTGLDLAITALRPRIGRINVVEIELARALRSAELEWARGLVRDLRAGRLTWNLEEILKHARAAAPEPKRKSSK